MTLPSAVPPDARDANGDEGRVTFSAGSAVVVLASGGLDSSTLLAHACEQGASPSALFVDYGQPAAVAEEAAVAAVCETLAAPLLKVQYRGARFAAGEIRGRNAFLLQTALMEFLGTSGVVLIGVHGGTGYLDCSPEFVELMQRSFDFHTGGAITVAAPFATWTKREIFRFARSLSVPIAQTYSCEAANKPCDLCQSCLERLALPVEACPR